jgi:hypothetical protein
MAVAAAAALVAVKTESPTVVPPRLVRVAARALVANPTELVKVNVFVPL